MISRRSHRAVIAPAAEVAPTDFAPYAPSIPHCRPKMKTSPSTMIAEPVIRMPAWRTVSPMNLMTRPFRTFASTRQQNSDATPNDRSDATRFTPSPPGPCPPLSSRRVQSGVGGQQRLGEHVVDRADREQRQHHRPVDGPPHALGTAAGGRAHVAADDRDHPAVQDGLDEPRLELHGR